jgi:uncharacterized protein YycO
MIRLQFVLGTGLASKAIAWFSAGKFSHVDTILESGMLLGARSDFVGGEPPGVRVRPQGYEKWDLQVVMTMAVNPRLEELYYEFLNKQLGKPYDKTAIWGFAAGRDWREDDSWFCSELCASGLEETTVLPVLYTPRNKVTPAALATAVSAAGGTW